MLFTLVSYARNKTELRNSKHLARLECWIVLEDAAHLAGKYLRSVCISRLVLSVVQEDIIGDRWHQIPLTLITPHVVDPLMSTWLTKEQLKPGPDSVGTAIQMPPYSAVGMAI